MSIEDKFIALAKKQLGEGKLTKSGLVEVRVVAREIRKRNKFMADIAKEKLAHLTSDTAVNISMYQAGWRK